MNSAKQYTTHAKRSLPKIINALDKKYNRVYNEKAKLTK